MPLRDHGKYYLSSRNLIILKYLMPLREKSGRSPEITYFWQVYQFHLYRKMVRVPNQPHYYIYHLSAPF